MSSGVQQQTQLHRDAQKLQKQLAAHGIAFEIGPKAFEGFPAARDAGVMGVLNGLNEAAIRAVTAGVAAGLTVAPELVLLAAAALEAAETGRVTIQFLDVFPAAGAVLWSIFQIMDEADRGVFSKSFWGPEGKMSEPKGNFIFSRISVTRLADKVQRALRHSGPEAQGRQWRQSLTSDQYKMLHSIQFVIQERLTVIQTLNSDTATVSDVQGYLTAVGAWAANQCRILTGKDLDWATVSAGLNYTLSNYRTETREMAQGLHVTKRQTALTEGPLSDAVNKGWLTRVQYLALIERNEGDSFAATDAAEAQARRAVSGQ